jgi:hypothetical protein
MKITTSGRREVEHIPERIEGIVVAILLARLGRHVKDFRTLEMTDRFALVLWPFQTRCSNVEPPSSGRSESPQGHAAGFRGGPGRRNGSRDQEALLRTKATPRVSSAAMQDAK